MLRKIRANAWPKPYVPLDSCPIACSCSSVNLKENHLEATDIGRCEKTEISKGSDSKGSEACVGSVNRSKIAAW